MRRSACPLGVAASLACAPGPGAGEPPPTPATIWRLAGVQTLGETGRPAYPGFTGAVDLLGPGCATAAGKLGARPPPCRVELWRPLEGGASEALFLVVGEATALSLGEATYRRSSRWPHIGPSLADCLGPPLDLPPAGDARGYRQLVVGREGPRWALLLSGANDCRLAGRIDLPIEGEGIGIDDLTVDGMPWRSGGQEAARSHRDAWIRAQIRARIQVMPPEERILGLEALARDPDPEAEAILDQLESSGGPGARDAAAAARRRAARAPEDP